MNAHKNMKPVNDANFNEAVGSGVKLVDFWAAWCMPCQMQIPILEELAEEYAGKADILALNVDENPDTAFANNITGIPALHLYRDGELIQRFVGVQPQAVLRDALDAQLEKAGQMV